MSADNPTGKAIEFRVFFRQGAFLHCPRCAALVTIKNFIINGTESGLVLVTAACSNCGDLVQVYAAGESYHDLPAIEERRGGIQKTAPDAP